MHRSWSGADLLDYPQVSLDDLSEPPPPHHTDSQPSTTRAARATVSAAALLRAEMASEKKKQPKMNAWQDAARDRAQSRRTGAALGNRGLPTNRPRKKVEASPFALLELPGLKLKLGMTVTDDGGKAARAEERARAHEEHRSRVRQLYSQALANRQVASERLGSSVPPDHFLARRRKREAATAGSTTPAPLLLPGGQGQRLGPARLPEDGPAWPPSRPRLASRGQREAELSLHSAGAAAAVAPRAPAGGGRAADRARVSRGRR